MKVTNYDDRVKMCRVILNRFDIKGDEDMLIRRMMAGDIWFLFTDDFNNGDPSNVLERLTKAGLLVLRFERSGNPCYSSGYDWKRTRKILMKEPMFANFIKKIERKFYIRHGFVCEYLGPGVFPYHPDGGYTGGFRLIVTIFETKKTISFCEDGKVVDEVTIKLCHGCGVLLADTGGGVIDGSIEHCVRDASGSIFLGLDIFPKKK